MPLINSQKYKINIDHNSNKIQGLKPGDIVRRQYTDGKNTVYTLMCVIANGIDKIADDKGVLHDSPYFIGTLLEGDAPENGQLLDFARITNLYDTERSGALYLTATDSGAPYMSVIDSEPGEKSIAYPTYLAPYNNTVLKDAYCINRRTNTRLVAEFAESLEDRKRVVTIKREENVYNADDEELFVTFKDEFPLSQIILVSYRASTKSKDMALDFQFGYTDKSSYDAKGTVTISTEPKYFLHVIQVDTAIRNTKGFFLKLNDVKNGVEPGNDLIVSDFSIVSLASVSSLDNNDKTRVGKISGIVDPVFGQLNGYGTYTENFYATGNTSISGTLTAGDENGFASTFYVGKIKKNILYNSLEPTVTNTSKNEDRAYYPPAKVGSSYLMPSSTQPHIYRVVDEDFYYANNGKRFTFSAWFYGISDNCSIIVKHGDTSKKTILSSGWTRVSLSFLLQGLEIEITNTGNVYFASPQLERGGRATLYQPTDGVLSDNEEEYGAWLCKGGIGGTIQNPLLKFGSDGSIRSKNDSFVINNDGTGHFAEGRFAWTKDKITLKEVTINWDSLDDETKDKLTSKSVQVFGDNIFHYSGSDSSSTPDKTSITITTSDNNFVPSSRKWEYMDSDGQWVEISGNGSTLTLTHNNSIWGGRDSIVIKYTASFDGKDYFDTITVYKVYSGETTCVITASLTSCVVSADHEGEIHADKTYTSIISAQKKNISVPVTIGSLPSVKGISLSKSGSSSLLITFRQGKDLDDYGYFNVPVTADGTTYSVTISYMKVKDGAPGENPGMLDWIQDWDSNKTTINGARILTPKIFAGTVHTNGSLTGLALGNIPLNVKNPTTGVFETREMNGLYGFKNGTCTWFFDANGNAQLGNGKNYIRYDSSTGKVTFGEDVVLIWSKEISNALDNANAYADEKLTEANQYTDDKLDEWADDGKVSPVEKSAIRLLISSLQGEYDQMILDAKKYGVSYSNYTTAYNKYKSDLEICASTSSEIVNIPSTFETNKSKYYTEKNKLSQAILDAIDTYNEELVSDATENIFNNTTIGSENYIRNSSFRESVSDEMLETNGGIACLRTSGVQYLGRDSLWVIQGNASNTSLSANYFYFKAINGKICKPAYFSMWVKGSVSGYVNIRIGGNNATIQRKAVSTGWTKVEVLNASSVTNSNVYIGFEQTGSFYIAMPMLAESSIPVDWSSADIDIENMVSAAEQAGENAQKTADDINKMIADGSWKAKLDTLEYDNNTEIGANYVFTGLLAAETVAAIKIDASQITAGTINTDRLNVSDIASKTVTADRINSLSLTTTKGKIGNWTIDGSCIYTGTKKVDNGFTTSGITLYGGSSGAIRAKNFRIDTDGSAYFKGEIKATSGDIGNWKIQTSGLYNNWVYIGSNGDVYCKNPNSGLVYWNINNAGTATFCQGKVTFNSGGSGSLAGGNITWDTSGNATFSGKLNAATGSFKGEITASSGTIGGWTINSSNISSGYIKLSSDGTISSTYAGVDYWKLNKDGSGFFSRGNIKWSTSGKFEIQNGKLGAWVVMPGLASIDENEDGSIYLFVGSETSPNGRIMLNSKGYISGGRRNYNVSGYTGFYIDWMLQKDKFLFGSSSENYSNTFFCLRKNNTSWFGNASTRIEMDSSGNVKLVGIAAKGEQGPAGEITSVTASVSNTVGTPSCTVTLGGTSSKRTINLAFKNLKGATGPQGPTGTLSANSTCYLPSSGTVFRNSSKNIGVKFSGGNGITGWKDYGNNIGHLYLNPDATSDAKVFVTNYSAVTGSDIRLKTVFYDVPDVLGKIQNISAFYHTRKDDEDKIMRIGVSAQAVREVFPELVRLITPENGDSYYAVNYIDLAATVAINGCKELHELIKGHQDVIMALEDKNRVLEEKVVTLEDRIARLEGLLAAKC